ncbi:MAG: energy-dependent translational throttle protein EttA [Zetaproteobacteria bacterium]|nr:energy-dependent translational throttle protein EttA [Pseudobdellovibrionaceae bacterium]
MTYDDKKIIYSMVGVGKKHGQRSVLKDIYLSYYHGAKIGVLGLNGSGKSSLLKIMAGEDTDYIGETHLSEGFSVGILHQEPRLNESLTVKEAVSEAVKDILDLQKKFDNINLKFGEDLSPEEMDKLIQEQAKVQTELDAHDAWTLDDRLNYAMQALSCPPHDQVISQLSGGEKRRVALCRLLIKEPDILLLDEPTNHLDAQSVYWLEKHLQQYKGTIIAVTHDRYFLDNVAGWILELDRGEGHPFKGNYSGWLSHKQERLALEKKSEDKRIASLKRELEWVQMSPKARQSKSKARLQAYDKLLNSEQATLAKDLKLYIPPGPRLGDIVIEASGLKKSYEKKTLFNNLNFKIPPCAVVGIVGPNGSGKTSLCKMITGKLTPDAGEIKLGSTVKVGFMEQDRMVLNQDETIYEAISGGNDTLLLGKQEVNSRAYVARFNFNGQDQQKRLKDLSGGERNRVQLALLLKEEANVLLFDEPSNDLDVNTLRALEEGILNFAGCAIIVSHDRWFLDRVATHILCFKDQDEVEWFEGNYSDYQEWCEKNKPKESKEGKGFRYQGLSR